MPSMYQVLSKRRKVVFDMCKQLATRARLAADTSEWQLISPTDGNVLQVVDSYLTEMLMPLAEKEPEHYNENAPLGHAISEAVKFADILVTIHDYP